MKVIQNAAYTWFMKAPEAARFGGTRIKQVRAGALRPGGRAALTLFEQVGEEGRAHPRLQLGLPPAEDPAPPGDLFPAPVPPPKTAADLEAALRAALAAAEPVLRTQDLPVTAEPAGSPRYWRQSIRVQRLAGFFEAARAHAAALPRGEKTAGLYAMRVAEDEAYAGRVDFDDQDTGTYHSFGHDAPFVHYLERILESLPVDGTEAFAALPPEQQMSVRRQIMQARSHLDHLMRRKYAHHGVTETHIEPSVGGFLIDRHSRNIASESPDSAGSLVPEHELLRVEPGAEHAHAGAWVYRDADGGIRLQDHTKIDVAPDLLRSVALDDDELTFRRAPDDPHLRPGTRLDWDGNGYVQPGDIEWVSWAGHCDIKAIMEELGVTLTDQPPLVEHRSETGTTTVYDRKLLVEMVASVLELGSLYQRADGSGTLERGIHRFGGARNDSRPDRLQFAGSEPGRGFRWPLGGREDTFRITAIEWGAGEGADMATVFGRHIPSIDEAAGALDFAKNPRYLKTVEGDYNLIDVSGARLEATLQCDTFDPTTGYPRTETQQTVVDLRPEATEKRFFLGTHLADAAARRVYRVYLDREKGGVVAELDAYAPGEDGKYAPRTLPEEQVDLPMAAPLTATLSREMKRDNPEMYHALLDVALRQAQNICADTDMKAPVWNGVVTRLEATKTAADPKTRVERWRVELKARFGGATLEYLLRRDARGAPTEWCPALSEDEYGRWPDFLWQDFPDVGSKGFEGDDWVVNSTMLERGIVDLEPQPAAPGGFYVYDDHIKNVFELLFAALGGYPWTLVHANKRYGFTEEKAWTRAVKRVARLRERLKFER